MPALVVFERVVSSTLKKGIIDEEEFDMLQTLDLEMVMTTLAGGFLVTNYHDAGRKVSNSSLDRGRKQKRPLRQTAVDAWHG